ncbi:ATP-dependent helicase [Corallococcus sp. Z5C101001]|uniref:ATP-dependent helicase n=1 Tax=Corallococcus sp. Z5C101001 TaxID=2596829 RepID=UPI0011809ABA|nr:ATP-dependent helicase [Corallococcus sp. Z5C101001]TSC31287.1 ATP-dependent helicase [Corallococcus sp. Z5C101001]
MAAPSPLNLAVPAGAPARRLDLEGALNDAQRAAVEAGEGPVLVIAGAGSGKTRTLTYRVARMLERGVPPAALLLLTFTNKAAREMLRRVEELAGGFADVGRLMGGTFHHAAHVLLRQHAGALGFSTGFTVLDREDARDLMATCLAERKLRSDKRFPRPDALLDLVSLATNLQQPVSEVLVERRRHLLPVAPEVFATARRFQQRKAQLHLMDYDDLLAHLKRLLEEHPSVRAELTARFQGVLVDEYQDTNRLQGDLVDLLAGERKNVTVVGDDCQSIYSFRGAAFTNIIDFPQRYPGCGIYPLTRNYRSTPQVLRLANAVIARNTRQFPKALQSDGPPGPVPQVVPTRDVKAQAGFVTGRVLALRAEGHRLESMAVLYRAHLHSLELQLELARHGLPFRVRSGVRFFEQTHVKDALAHLRWAHNRADELAFKRLARRLRGVGSASTEHLWTALAALPPELPVADALAHADVQAHVPRKAQAGFQRFQSLMSSLSAGGPRGPGALLAEVLAAREVPAGPDVVETHAEDLRQLQEFAGRFEDVPRFLSDIALVSEFSARAALDGGGEGGAPDDVLTLTTVHQAKGLEWRTVFVLGLTDGRFPLSRVTLAPEEEEEERRLFYVAVTRAREALWLVYPHTSLPREDGRLLLTPSRFLSELPSGPDAVCEALPPPEPDGPIRVRELGPDPDPEP